ncbi:DNA topoisomerase VI subunit B [Lysobacter sp. OAE881]|uniref:hypothetical protein n=1 Tax=Lysobacter sp. OAE881 TaxID=2663813 RepID=UPI00178AE6FD
MGIREAIALVLAAVLFASGWYMGALSGRLGKANAEQRIAAQKLDEVLTAQQDDKKRAEKLQKTLDRLPKSEGKVREIVRENPSKCDRPVVVAERVREAAREANRAREMPSDF